MSLKTWARSRTTWSETSGIPPIEAPFSDRLPAFLAIFAPPVLGWERKDSRPTPGPTPAGFAASVASGPNGEQPRLADHATPRTTEIASGGRGPQASSRRGG